MKPTTIKYPVVLLFIMIAPTLFAQEISDTVIVVREAKKKVKMPFVTKAIIGAGYAGAVYMTYKYADAPMQHETQERKSRFSDGWATIVSEAGEDKYHYIAAGSLAAVGFISKNPRLKQTVLMWSTALLTNDLLTNKIKKAVHRYRPSSGKSFDSFAGEDGNGLDRSFPSAHTSSAFATATIFATQYKDKGWVAPVAYGLATVVGVSRIYKNAHWTSDVLAGAAVGYLSGKLSVGMINFFQKKRVMVAPGYGQGRLSLSVVYSPVP